MVGYGLELANTISVISPLQGWADLRSSLRRRFGLDQPALVQRFGVGDLREEVKRREAHA